LFKGISSLKPPLIIRGALDALEVRLADDISERRARDPLGELTVLVGSTLLRPYLRQRLTELRGGLVNVRFITFDDLAVKLAALAAGLSATQPLPSYGERIIAEETAERARGYFEPVAHAAGFAQALERLLRDLRSAGLSPATLAAAIDELDAVHTGSTGKLTALAALFAESEQRRNGFHGRNDLIRMADAERFRSSELLVYGIWNFTTIQQQMLKRLMEHAALTVYLPDGQPDANGIHASLRAWLASLGATELRLDAAETAPTALCQLQARIFARPDGQSAPADGSVRLVSAPDTVREVREAARACLGWANEGIAFHEMAVTYRQTEPYRGLIDEIFREARIPLYLHDGSPLIERPVGRSLAALLALIGSRLTRAAVMEFLTETTLPPDRLSALGGFEPAAWDQLSRDAGIVEGREQWFDRLTHLQTAFAHSFIFDDPEADERLQARVAEIDRFRRFVRDFFDRLDEWPERDSWDGFRERLGALAGDYIDGVAPIIEALAELDHLGVLTESISFARFVRAVRAALQQIDGHQLFGEPAGSFARSGVNALDVNSLRHLRFRAVIVLGLSERAFPPPPRQDALLLDDERRGLNEVIDGELPLRAAGVDPEPLQFTLALAAARERLVLSYARGDDKRDHLPSYFFRAAAGILSGAPVRIAGIDRLDPAFFDRVPANRFGAARPDAALSAGEYDRTLMGIAPALGQAALVRRAPGFARAREAWQARWRNPALTAWDGALDPAQHDAISSTAKLTTVLSPTRLEAYAVCPYRFFLQSVLKLSEIEEPEAVERISALERGSLIHTILNRFLTEVSAELPPEGEAAYELLLGHLLATAAEACDEWDQRGAAGYKLLWEFDKLAIFEDLEIWFAQEIERFRASGTRPAAFEVRFGNARYAQADESGYSVNEPLAVPIETGTLRFQGRIDRIDWNADQTAFRVIDYKTGKSYGNHDDQFERGTKLQLPLYLLAAGHALRQHGISMSWEQGRAEYDFVTRRGEFKQARFSGQALQARWDDFEQLLDDMSAQIAAGDFHPEPGDGRENCRYCLGRHVCDQRIVRLAGRKAEARSPRFLRIQAVE
jgi:ATP-dependent helicase/DNAse subunit B